MSLDLVEMLLSWNATFENLHNEKIKGLGHGRSKYHTHFILNDREWYSKSLQSD